MVHITDNKYWNGYCMTIKTSTTTIIIIIIIIITTMTVWLSSAQVTLMLCAVNTILLTHKMRNQ